MTIVAIILMVLGFGLSALIFTGTLPESLRVLANQPTWIYLGIGALGVILAVLNRRPRD